MRVCSAELLLEIWFLTKPSEWANCSSHLMNSKGMYCHCTVDYEAIIIIWKMFWTYPAFSTAVITTKIPESAGRPAKTKGSHQRILRLFISCSSTLFASTVFDCLRRTVLWIKLKGNDFPCFVLYTQGKARQYNEDSFFESARLRQYFVPKTYDPWLKQTYVFIMWCLSYSEFLVALDLTKNVSAVNVCAAVKYSRDILHHGY